MTTRNVMRVVLGAVFYPALLFGTAGTLNWVEGWVFFGVQAAFTTVLYRWLARNDPELMAERLKGLLQPGQPRWDRVILLLFSFAWLLWFLVPGLDAVRFRWSSVPVGWKIVGGLLHLLGWIGLVWTHRTNTFLAPVVRIQEERDHAVIDTGPYAIVRHPMYAAFFLWMPGAGLMLGSLWATIGSLVPISTLVVRTALEDRCLARDLSGYDAYRQRVRFKLLPGVW